MNMPRIIIIFAVLLCGSSLFSQEAAINAELKQADRLTREGNYEEALVHINNALEANPLHLTSLEKKAVVRFICSIRASKSKQ